MNGSHPAQIRRAAYARAEPEAGPVSRSGGYTRLLPVVLPTAER